MICLIQDVELEIQGEFGNIKSKISSTRLLLHVDDIVVLKSDLAIA